MLSWMLSLVSQKELSLVKWEAGTLAIVVIGTQWKLDHKQKLIHYVDIPRWFLIIGANNSYMVSVYIIEFGKFWPDSMWKRQLLIGMFRSQVE